MPGLINVFKPAGWTSRDIVTEVRRRLGIKKAGHAGTLDPGAVGVLLVLLGRATRIQRYMTELEKQYIAEVTLGIETDSSDAFGTVMQVQRRPGVSLSSFRDILTDFIGDVSQVPPMTSAVKHRGRPLYELARKGVVVDRDPRSVTIRRLDLLDWRADDEFPRALLLVECSSGTYIRTLVSDIARAAGTCGYMSHLTRTQVGDFTASGSVLLEDISDEAIVRAGEALRFLRCITLTPEDAGLVSHGNRPRHVELDLFDDREVVRAMSAGGDLLAIGEVYRDGTGGDPSFRPRRVFNPPL